MISNEEKRKKLVSTISRGKVAMPWRGLLYGVEGIGKSTFGAATPKPIFIGAEDGTNHIDVARFPSPAGWEELKEQAEAVASGETEYKTLVLDTIDHAEPMLWDFICRRDKEKNIETYGYGKGYQVALDEWRIFLRLLESARKNGVNVLFLGHSQVKNFKNPEGPDFDRYEMMMNVKAAGLIKQWVDFVFFANHETFTSKDEKTKRVKGVSTGVRLIFTTKTAAYDAKNRNALPESMPLNWADVEVAMGEDSASQEDRAVLIAEIFRKGDQLGRTEDLKKAVERADSMAKLMELNTWCNSKLSLTQRADVAGKQA